MSSKATLFSSSFSDEELIIDPGIPSLFLAGPTPRDQDTESWRPRALDILEKIGFKGIVYIPEFSSWITAPDYNHQVNWELEALEASKKILFWVPRNLKTLPGFTTNVEFGYWLPSGKVLYGRPPKTPKTRYLDFLYERDSGNTPCLTLSELLNTACGCFS
ncbi:hypothetical protein HN803_03110 [candidate division WWE3 bacterium]|jgi:hypothetical protein|nr:hypothetical protein [candidate division WWE3 bacterium]